MKSLKVAQLNIGGDRVHKPWRVMEPTNITSNCGSVPSPVGDLAYLDFNYNPVEDLVYLDVLLIQ